MSEAGRPSRSDLERFVTCLGFGERRLAVQRALAMIRADVPFAEVVTGLLAPAQVEVGERWYRNEWTVAEEHRATYITDAVLTSVAAAVDVGGDRGHVVVTCAEGEWHALPARMVAELLGHRGWRVSLLGASTPARHLAAFLDVMRPDALLVSCTVPLFLGGVLDLVRAGHGAGVPVLVGGRALGPDARRGEVLGADAWAPTAADAADVLERWNDQPPVLREDRPGAPAPVADEDTAEAVFAALATRWPPLEEYDARQLAATREDVGFIVQFLSAAILADDDRVFLDFVAWLRDLLVARSVPEEALVVALESLADVVADDVPRAAALARRGRDVASGAG